MKHTLLLLLFGITSNVFSQTIDGLGSFKINKTTISELQFYLESEDYYFEKLTSSREVIALINSPNKAAAIIEKSTNRVIYEPTCKNSKVIVLNNLNIANLDLKKIRFTFIDDELVTIQGDGNSDLDEAFDEKYGKTKLNIDEKKVECLYKLTGLTRELKEVNYVKKWQKENDEIFISSSLNTYFDDNCEKQTTYTFLISTTENMRRMYSCLNDKKPLKADIDKL